MSVEFWSAYTYFDAARTIEKSMTGKTQTKRWEDYYNADNLSAVCKDTRSMVVQDDAAHNNDEMEKFAEWLLFQNGRQYFKVYPEFVEALTDTSLSIPCEHFKVPYKAFEILLPKGQAHFVCRGEALRSLMVFDGKLAQKLRMDSLQGVGTYDKIAKKAKFELQQQAEAVGITLPPVDTYDDIRHLCVYGSTQEVTTVGAPQTYFMSCILKDGLTIEDCIDMQNAPSVRESLGLREIDKNHLDEIKKVYRFVASMCMLITGHDRIIAPDVLRKDEEKLRRAKTPEDVTKLQGKASRRRKQGTGWFVGRNERILQLAEQRASSSVGEDGKELKFQHQRRGHMHRFKTKEGYIVKWLPQVTIRPDLPMKKTSSGRGGILK